jgi:hypothetical protein
LSNPEPMTRKARRRARRALRKAGESIAKAPGPSTNPATNLLIGDIAMRGLSMLLGRGIESVLLKTRYDAEKAKGIVQGRTLTQSLMATGAARVATKSVPGFLAVSGGLLAKAVFDRALGRKESRKQGERTLSEQAANADEQSI